MERFIWVCVAGGAGTGARYLIGLWASRFETVLPFGTFIANMMGCFAMAGVMHIALAQSWSPTLRATVTVGFIGGLTTYSSFNYETSQLFATDANGAAMLNLAATVVGAFVCGWLGMLSAQYILGR